MTWTQIAGYGVAVVISLALAKTGDGGRWWWTVGALTGLAVVVLAAHAVANAIERRALASKASPTECRRGPGVLLAVAVLVMSACAFLIAWTISRRHVEVQTKDGEIRVTWRDD